MIPVMIVPVLSGYDRLQEMFDTIDYPIEHAIIIDNGGSLKHLHSDFIKEISIINMPYNLGISIPYNLGIKLTPMAKYWLFAQNDIKWIPGGLSKIHQLSDSDSLCIAMNEDRPFACRTIGENVIAKIGLLDEYYFPAPGDDFNLHKRCHYHNIQEKDISGTYLAEKSSTIKDMILSRQLSIKTWCDNYTKSLYGPPINRGWILSARRNQGLPSDEPDDVVKSIIETLDNEYRVHSKDENLAFKYSLNI